MEKPQCKREVAITFANEKSLLIQLYATKEAMEDFSSFGDIMNMGGEHKYTLHVDPRFDFQEVVAYIEAYDTEESLDFLGTGEEQ